MGKFFFLTKKRLEELAAQDGGHFAHAGLEGLLVWTSQAGLVSSEQTCCSLGVYSNKTKVT